MKIQLLVLLSWALLWIIFTVILFFILSGESQNGYILRKDCIREKEDICLLYSSTYKVGFYEELRIQSVGAGIIIGGSVIILGYSNLLLGRFRRRVR